jgi:hypothetical protein
MPMKWIFVQIELMLEKIVEATAEATADVAEVTSATDAEATLDVAEATFAEDAEVIFVDSGFNKNVNRQLLEEIMNEEGRETPCLFELVMKISQIVEFSYQYL